MKHIFQEGDLLWSEVSILAQAIISRWKLNVHARGQLSRDLELLGRVCPCVKLENTFRHDWMIQNGQFNDSCVFEECAASVSMPDVRYLYDDLFVVRIEQIVFGHAYQIAQAHAKNIGKTSAFLDVARHLRNGAFHNNKFFFKRGEPRGIPTWRTLQITKSLEGQTVFGHADGVISLGDVPVLMSDIMNELR